MHGDKIACKSRLILSMSQLENVSNNISFHSQDNEITDFKLKLLHIFNRFKNDHLQIIKKFDHLKKKKSYG